jgi:hypothetical protein
MNNDIILIETLKKYQGTFLKTFRFFEIKKIDGNSIFEKTN